MPALYIPDTSLEMYKKNYLYEFEFLTGLFMMLLNDLRGKRKHQSIRQDGKEHTNRMLINGCNVFLRWVSNYNYSLYYG